MLFSCLTLETHRKLLLALINYIHLTYLLEAFLFCLPLSAWSFSIWKITKKGENILFKWNTMQVYKVMKSNGRLSRDLRGVTQGLVGCWPRPWVLSPKQGTGWVGLRLKGKRKYSWQAFLNVLPDLAAHSN